MTYRSIPAIVLACFLAAGGLIASPAASAAPAAHRLSLVVNSLRWRSGSDRHSAPGIGIEYLTHSTLFGGSVSLNAGRYLDAADVHQVYLGTVVRWHVASSAHGLLRLSLGAAAGITHRPSAQYAHRTIPYLLPVATIWVGPVAVSITAVPTYEVMHYRGGSPTVLAQLMLPL